jgi:hypothetical protein
MAVRLAVTQVRQLILAVALIVPGAGRAEEGVRRASVDTEHIFGFTEGADVGAKGEHELEDTLTGRFGKPGSYAALRNEAAFRYVIADGLRLGLGVTADQYVIRGVPNLDDRTAFDFSGVVGELRWQMLRFDRAPLGLTLSIAPQWQLIDGLAGQRTDIYSLPFTLLADVEPIAERLYAAFNLTVAPAFIQLADRWREEAPIEVSAAGAFALAPRLFIGAEIRHLNHNQQGFLTGHALFVGPSLYVKVSEAVAVKVAWSIQIPDETTGTLDLVNHERNQVRLQLVKAF